MLSERYSNGPTFMHMIYSEKFGNETGVINFRNRPRSLHY